MMAPKQQSGDAHAIPRGNSEDCVYAAVFAAHKRNRVSLLLPVLPN